MDKGRDCVDALRLSEEEQRSVLRELDDAVRAPLRPELRQSPRYRYFVPGGIILEVVGVSATYVVRPRNLSAGGISFLHGTFLYPATACTVWLKALDGHDVRTPGWVVRGRCVRGRVHEIAVRFQERIDVRKFVTPENMRPERQVPEKGPCTSYQPGEVLQLALELEELALRAAPRDCLIRKLAELVALLRCPDR